MNKVLLTYISALVRFLHEMVISVHRHEQDVHINVSLENSSSAITLFYSFKCRQSCQIGNQLDFQLWK